MKIYIEITDEQEKILAKRAKKNLFTIKEQIEGIVRRSCINSPAKASKSTKIDDALVEIFSREKRGKWKK